MMRVRRFISVGFAGLILALDMAGCMPPPPAQVNTAPPSAPASPYVGSVFTQCTYFPLGVESGTPPPVPIPQSVVEVGTRMLDGCPDYVALPFGFATVLPQDPKNHVFLSIAVAAPDRCIYTDSGANANVAKCQLTHAM